MYLCFESQSINFKFWCLGRLYSGLHNNRIFCSAPPNYGFYLYSKKLKSGKRQQKFDNFITTTGMAVDRKKNKLYHADACGYTIMQYDWDPKTGEICENTFS